ncbi:hypothetical protein C8Q74DRAFT_212643 [Fomes fomentarius]|nr:hypothetical protein C8Q74DRAFT_212643 [Fomes fomentarius]
MSGDSPTATNGSAVLSKPCLNFDVLAKIVESIDDKADVLSVSLTCTSLRRTAARHLLHLIQTVLLEDHYITSAHDITSFHQFILVDETRSSCIRAMELSLELPSDIEVSCIRDILAHATSLQVLYLPRYNPPMHASLSSSIVGLRTLKELSIDLAGFTEHEAIQLGPELIHQLTSPIKILRADFGPHELSARQVDDFLGPLHSTLELLKLQIITIDLSEQTDPFPLAPCTLLRSFLVNFVELYPRLDVFLQWFPSLDGVLDLGMFDFERSRQSEYTSLREGNIRAQKTRSWERLDKLVCEATMFYVLGLRCPIHHLVIDYCGALVKQYVADTLEDNPPRQLTLHITLWHGIDVFVGLFQRGTASTLTRLTLNIEFANSLNDADQATVEDLEWTCFVDRISSCLCPLRRLTHLRILVHCQCDSDPTYPAPYSESFVDSVRNFDFEGTVARLASAMPSLSVIILTSTGIMQDRDEGDRYWITKQEWSETRAGG